MPIQQEKVTQIEAALRRRFFKYIPKNMLIGARQSEEWHDVNRLSRALAAYALVGLAELEDHAAAAAVTDGGNDGGIDALHYSRDQLRLYVVQSKFKRKGEAPDQGECLKTINGVRDLISRRFGKFNQCFQPRIDEIEEALDTPGVVVHVVLVCLGERLGPHATDDLDGLKSEFNTFNETICWECCGATKVHEWLIEQEQLTAVTENVTIENWGAVDNPRKAVYGQVLASELAELVTKCGKALFERNIRHYLGSVGVNNAIAQTVRTAPDDLFYLNNGITAVAESIVKSAGNNKTCVFQLTNFSIVNGAQTVGSISTAGLGSPISPNAKVLITIIEIGTANDNIGHRITSARNHQTTVRGVDFAALDPTQERLRQELAVAGITYYYRPSAESRTMRYDAFTLEEAAVALACMNFPILTSTEVDQNRRGKKNIKHSIEMVVASKKEIGRLWDQSGDLYSSLFPEDLSAVRMCRIVRLCRIIDEVLAASELAESRMYNRKMFFRHGRHFIMAFVASRSADILSKSSTNIDEPDRRTLSERINRIAEAIYAESASFHGSRGYLAIFRNLTDSQPLADRVLARLKAEDDKAALAARQAEHLDGATQ